MMEWGDNGGGWGGRSNAVGGGCGGGGGELLWKERGLEEVGMVVGGVVEEAMCMNVMTDEQMEVLRKQISTYATICEQLVELHKAVTAQQDSLAGMRLGNLYCDSLLASGHKIMSRQRWTPTPMQLHILETIFDQGIGTPSKQKIKEITSELSQHGQITETNVYNWFQNRRARSKRKQTVTLLNNGESEVETEVNSPKEKKAKSVNSQLPENMPSSSEAPAFRIPEANSEAYSASPESNRTPGACSSNDDMKSADFLGQMPFFDDVLRNPRIDQFVGKMEMEARFNFSRFDSSSYNMMG